MEFACEKPEQIDLDLPHRNSLSLFSLALTPEVVKTRYMSLHSAQTMTLREIILEPGWDCLAAPAMVAGRILVVVPKNFVMTKLNSMLEKFQLKVAVANANVTSDQLADCLKYTMAVRLAPEWNKVSNQLLHGPNFLLTYQNSIMSLEVEIRHRPNMQSYMSVMARQVRYPVAKLEDLGVDHRIIAQFHANKNWTIFSDQIKNRWCRVLPTMKKGEIVGIKRKFGKDSVFSSYADLCVYWEKMYGYVLPRPDSCPDLFFYEILFRRIGPTPFTYPNICVLTGLEHRANLAGKATLLRHFCTDLIMKMPTVCGKDLAIIGNPAFLPLMRPVVEKDLPSPLTERKINCLENYGYRKKSPKKFEQITSVKRRAEQQLPAEPEEPKLYPMFKPKRPLSSAQSHDAKLRDLVLPKAVNPAPKFNFVPVGFPFPVVKKPKFIYPYEPSVLDRSASRWFASQSQEGSPPPWANKLEILVANIKPEE